MSKWKARNINTEFANPTHKDLYDGLKDDINKLKQSAPKDMQISILKESPLQTRIMDFNVAYKLKVYVEKYYLDKDNKDENKELFKLANQYKYLIDMGRSIKYDGLKQPIMVRPIRDEYEIVWGHQRVMASIIWGLDTILAFVKEMDDKEVVSSIIIENSHRKDLDRIEEAIGFRNALDLKLYNSQKELAKSIGYTESDISKILKLLHLPKPIIDDLRASKRVKDIKFLGALNSLNSDEKKIEFYNKLINNEEIGKVYKSINSYKKAKNDKKELINIEIITKMIKNDLLELEKKLDKNRKISYEELKILLIEQLKK